ncbi:MAG: class I SAM-dependent methyltransferase [Actinomycetota bacterium]
MSPSHDETARTVYDRSAAQYAAAVGTTVSRDFEARVDLAQLTVFADECRALPPGRALDAGCGSGRIARFLADRGVDVLGTDIAPGMIDVARRAHPDIPFEVAPLTALPIDDRKAVGVAYWYSIIATPATALDEVWQELRRSLTDGGVALVAFQCGGGEAVERPDAYGTGTALTLYRHSIDAVTTGLERAGLQITAVTQRAPRFEHETTPQAFVHACA